MDNTVNWHSNTQYLFNQQILVYLYHLSGIKIHPTRSSNIPWVATGKLGPTLLEAQKIDGFPTFNVVIPSDFRAPRSFQSSKVFDTPVKGAVTDS